MGAVKLTEVWNKHTREVNYKLTADGANRAQFLDAEQLSELHDLIHRVQRTLNNGSNTQ